jgi:predicted kinase
MKKVIIMRGLPGSGKSTLAKKLIDENPNAYKRINRDELRMMFDNGHYTKGNEKFIKRVRDLLILKSLEEGKHVIVDDTNLPDTTETHIRELVHHFNQEHGDEVHVELMEMDVSLDECIVRDAKRENPVGEKVIRTMHSRFSVKDPKYLEQNKNLPRAVICDMDGTLALLNGRNPYNASACHLDLPNPPVVSLVRTLIASGLKLILVSGRKDDCKEQTLVWLEKMEINYELLLMRGAKDMRKDSIIKRELFDNFIRDKYFVEFVLDDRNQVVDMWRKEIGLPCFQVYYGDF